MKHLIFFVLTAILIVNADDKFPHECYFNEGASTHLIYHCIDDNSFSSKSFKKNCSKSNQLEKSNVRSIKYECDTKISSLKLNPLELNNFTNLDEIDISSLEIYTFQFGPGIIKKRVNLKASHNEIGNIPRSMLNYMPKISHIDFSYNVITYLQSADFTGNDITRLPSISKLNFAHNEIASIEDGAFANVKSLEELDLSENKITFIHDKLFAQNRQMKTLNLRSNSLSHISSEMLKMLPNLEYLDLSANPISGIGDDSFLSNRDLEHIKLSNANINTIEKNAFLNQRHLKSLDLSYNNLINVDSSIYAFNELETLILKSNQLTTIDTINPTNFPKIKTLEIANNKFKDEYLKEFFKQWETKIKKAGQSDGIEISGEIKNVAAEIQRKNDTKTSTTTTSAPVFPETTKSDKNEILKKSTEGAVTKATTSTSHPTSVKTTTKKIKPNTTNAKVKTTQSKSTSTSIPSTTSHRPTVTGKIKEETASTSTPSTQPNSIPSPAVQSDMFKAPLQNYVFCVLFTMFMTSALFSILYVCRTRYTKTEYSKPIPNNDIVHFEPAYEEIIEKEITNAYSVSSNIYYEPFPTSFLDDSCQKSNNWNTQTPLIYYQYATVNKPKYVNKF